MKQGLFFLTLLFFISPAWAEINMEPLLNKVSMNLQAEQWVTTKTALVDVNINATVTDKGMELLQKNVLTQLDKIANQGKWHIVSLNRQEDKSELETVQILAQARLPQSALINLRQSAKAVSKPGENYTIVNIQFTPSEEEIRNANTQLRQSIYEQAKGALNVLNQIYPDQHFYLYQINFNSLPPVMPFAQNMMAVAKAAPMTQSLSIGNKVTLEAQVVLAALPATFISNKAVS